MDEYYVYMHVNKINNKKYIGITKRLPKERWGNNGNKYTNSTHFKNAIAKYGWDSFEHLILYEHKTKEEACELEVELIQKYKTTNPEFGYNLDSGGVTPTHSEETKNKIRNKITGVKRSEETKEKIRKASTGNKNCLGKKMPDETKKKISEAKQGCCGHEWTKEQRENARKKQKKNMKPVFCIELNKVFESVCDAARFVNGSQGTISSVLVGTRKTAYKYHWIYSTTI